MSKFIWFAALALASASYAQDGKVTYTTVAVSAKKAIADLAEKSGMKLACAPAMEKEILILRLHDAPIDAVMAQIAAATLGSWDKQGDITYLVPNGNLRSNEAARIQQRITARISENLKKQLEAYSKVPKKGAGKGVDEGADADFEAGIAAASMFGGMGMGSHEMLKLAVAIGANQLAGVPEDGRIVYSSNPTRMQRSLPGGSEEIIGEFVTEYNKTAALAKQDEPAKDAANDDESNMFLALFANKMKKPKPITTAPATAVVVASRKGMFAGFTLELKLYDAQGIMLASSSFPIQSDSRFDPETIMKAQAAPKDDGPELQISPLSKEFKAAGGGGMMGGGSVNLKISKELMDALKDPVARDPLSFEDSDALIAIANQRDEQLVADLPDDVMSAFEFGGDAKAKLTATSFLNQIKGEDKAKVLESNGWMVVSAENFVKARKSRTDRESLRALIQVSVSQGYVGLDTLSAYALKNESPMFGAPASTTYFALFAPTALEQGMMGSNDWDLVRLYGMLDATQRQSIRSGGRLAFGQLSPDQQNQLSKMLFGANGVLMVENPNDAAKKKQDPLTEMMMSQMDRFTGANENDYRSEPTEIMPNGLPSNGSIVVKFSAEPVAKALTMSTNMGSEVVMGPTELGMFKFFKEDPSMAQASTEMPTFDDMKVGTRSVFDFSIYVAPNVCQKGQLNDDVIPKDAPVFKMANLPPDFQKKIDDIAASLKTNPFWQMVGKMGGMGQKGVPPPN